MKSKLRVLLFLIFLSLPVAAHTGGKIKVTCPVCSTKFETQVTMSSTRMGALRDFEARGAVGSMYEDGVASCTACHYSWETDDFEKPVTPNLKKWVLSDIKPKYAKGEIDKVEAYKTYARIAAHKLPKDLEQATIYRLASYVARHENKPEAERRQLQAEVATHLISALEKKEVSAQEVVFNTYLVGEMLRRQAKFSEALPWYDKASKAPLKEGSDFGKWIQEQRKMAEAKDANNNL